VTYTLDTMIYTELEVLLPNSSLDLRKANENLLQQKCHNYEFY